jgi:hypothetical protein
MTSISVTSSPTVGPRGAPPFPGAVQHAPDIDQFSDIAVATDGTVHVS